MGDFFDRRLAVQGAFDLMSNEWFGFPRQIKARIMEARPVRSPRVYVTIRGGSGLSAGETVFDVETLSVRLGFEDDAADRPLTFSTCSFTLPK